MQNVARNQSHKSIAEETSLGSGGLRGNLRCLISSEIGAAKNPSKNTAIDGNPLNVYAVPQAHRVHEVEHQTLSADDEGLPWFRYLSLWRL